MATLRRVTVRMTEEEWEHFSVAGAGDVAEGVRVASGKLPYCLPRGLAGADDQTRTKVSRRGVRAKKRSKKEAK